MYCYPPVYTLYSLSALAYQWAGTVVPITPDNPTGKIYIPARISKNVPSVTVWDANTFMQDISYRFFSTLPGTAVPNTPDSVWCDNFPTAHPPIYPIAN